MTRVDTQGLKGGLVGGVLPVHPSDHRNQSEYSGHGRRRDIIVIRIGRRGDTVSLQRGKGAGGGARARGGGAAGAAGPGWVMDKVSVTHEHTGPAFTIKHGAHVVRKPPRKRSVVSTGRQKGSVGE